MQQAALPVLPVLPYVYGMMLHARTHDKQPPPPAKCWEVAPPRRAVSAMDASCEPLVPAGYHAVPCGVPPCPAASDNAFESDASITGLIESLEGIADMLCFGTGKLNRTHAACLPSSYSSIVDCKQH